MNKMPVPRCPGPQEPLAALGQTPWSSDGGQESRGNGGGGPAAAADKLLLTMGLSVRGSPDWFVCDLTGRGAAVRWRAQGRGPGGHRQGACVVEAPRPGEVYSLTLTPSILVPMCMLIHSCTHTWGLSLIHTQTFARARLDMPNHQLKHHPFPYIPHVFTLMHVDIFTQTETHSVSSHLCPDVITHTH